MHSRLQWSSRELEPTDIGAIVILGGRLSFLRARFSQPRRMFEIRIAFSTSNLSARDKRAIDSVLRPELHGWRTLCFEERLLYCSYELIYDRNFFKQIIIFFRWKMRERRTVALIIFKFDRGGRLSRFSRLKVDRVEQVAKDILIIKTSRSSRYANKIEIRISFLRRRHVEDKLAYNDNPDEIARTIPVITPYGNITAISSGLRTL